MLAYNIFKSSTLIHLVYKNVAIFYKLLGFILEKFIQCTSNFLSHKIYQKILIGSTFKYIEKEKKE